MENQNNQNNPYNMNRLMNPGAENTPLDAGYNITNNLDVNNDAYNQLVDQAMVAKKKRATNDMIYGALWCVGGIVATASLTGAIFWGAIVFGAFQFIRGAVNYGS